ncbi:hypothetical protein HDU83_001155 [Entophlyctis luteolus]|nr:hypothetical protein HDU82_005449 [Entophlyctis luteolus]KAJ3348613.1 hypothetical protein HDU83_001155 [Entophlyctis luteolus]
MAVDDDMMLLALEQAALSPPVEGAYCVGAVLAAVERGTSTAVPLTVGFSREIEGNTHAEECCLLKLSDAQRAQYIANPTYQIVMYTTMEPCGLRLSGKKPCADRILEAGFISRVVFAIREPPNFVENCTGAQTLADKGIEVTFLDEYAERARFPFKHLWKA